MTDVSGARAPAHPGPAQSSTQLISSVNCRLWWLLNLLAYKICSRNRRFSLLLGSKQPSFKFAGQDQDNEGRGFIRRSNLDAGYLSFLESPTDVRSIVCDAKEDVLASYQKSA